MTMSDEKFYDEIADESLMQALQGAYESMDPTEEQQQRMLAKLVETQASSGSASHDEAPEAEGIEQLSATAERSDAGVAGTHAPSANRSRGFKVWRIAVPLAACLALGAVVVGVAGSGGMSAQPSEEVASSLSASAAAEKGEITAKRDQGNDALASGATEANGETAEKAATATNAAAASSNADAGGAEEVELLEDDAVGDAAPEAAYDAMALGAASVETESVEDGAPVEGTQFNTEEYNALKETGFVSTKANPLSTVSADVDTASYCNIRRMVSDGAALGDIPSGAVRIEEMLNYFDYDYTAPSTDSGELFSMQAQSAACPWNEDAQLLVMGFSTAEESKAANKGSNLVFLVDVSGSMDSPDKLDLLQDSFATLLDSLGTDDRVSIVTYASGEEIVLEGAAGDDDKAILKAIYKLRADGSTNGEAGLKQAYEVAKRNFIEGGVNRIIMASDGDLNVGVTSESDLYDLVDGQRESGIYLSVLGFGSGNYKDNKMETLADHGNGSYHYIDCTEEAERVLKENLTANLVPFADNVKVQVEFNPAQVKAYRLIGYENRALADEDFRNDAVDAGDVGPNAQFTVAYELILADSKYEIEEPDLKYATDRAYESDTSEWLTCSLRYHAFDGDEMREQQLAVDAASANEAPGENWNLAAAVIEFGMLARDSEYAGTSSEDAILDLLAGAGKSDQVASFRKLVVAALP